MEFLTINIEDRMALITINRPKVLNALNAGLLEELRQLMTELSNNNAIGSVVITGAGLKSFVAGADIKELVTLDPVAAKEVATRGQSVFSLIENCPKPVIAAINGFALGGGCELALACHLRVASDNARLGLPEVGLGLIPGYGGTQRLARIVGKGLALEMILTGGMIKAPRAYEIGLVNHVTTPEALLDKCRELAAAIMSKGPLATRFALEAVNYGLEMPHADGERLEANLFGLLAATEDCKEGLSAFLDKREPDFQGR